MATITKRIIALAIVSFICIDLYSQSQEFEQHYFIDLQGSFFPFDEIGLYGNVALGKQFSPFLGIGLSYTGVLQSEFLTESYSGIAVRYQIDKNLFFAGADVGAILKYSKVDDYCAYEYPGGTGLFIQTHGGLKLWNWLKLGVMGSFVPEMVTMEYLCPNIDGELTIKTYEKVGFFEVMPFIGVHFSIK